MRSVSKRFGATVALRNVSLQVQAGEVLALVGENGAGKSTLMKVLSGAHAPDTGTMLLGGQMYAPRGPHAARKAGVAMIYQELNLAPDLTVLDNVMLGRELNTAGLLHRGEQRRRVRKAFAELGHADLPLDVPAGTLSIASQQLVEIARALAFDAKVIVFDEPTSSLPVADVEKLFAVIGRLKRAGLAVIYISHFLEELRRVADRYTVLRDGTSVGSGDLRQTSEQQLVALMVGRSMEELFPSSPHTPGAPILSLEGLSGRERPHDVSFELRRGEVLGIGGLVGAGRTELLKAIFGLEPVRSGKVRVGGIAIAHRPRARIRAGLGFVSEDRKTEGLAQNQSIADNLTASRLAPYSTLGWLNLARRRAAVVDYMRQLQIKARSPSQPVSELSGGNQQKVALARVLHQQAEILLLDEPTRGIDVGTKAEIYRLMGRLAGEGKAIIFVSSYFPELLAVCDRIGVMARGRLREIRPADAWTEESLLQCAIGAEGQG